MMQKFMIDQQKKDNNPTRGRNSMFFSFLGLFLGLTDRKKARCPKLDFPVKDIFNHWLSATHKKFDLLETKAKSDFQNFALDL